MDNLAVIDRNLRWFRNSGVLLKDGLEGVCERARLLDREHPIVNGNRLQQDGLFKYVRVDCVLQTATLFALADNLFPSRGYKYVSDNLLKFIKETPFQENRLDHSEFGLFAHGLTFDYAFPVKMIVEKNPTVRHYKDNKYFWDKKWPDDNSWAVILPLALWANGYSDELRDYSLLAAQSLLDKREILDKYARNKMDGMPHWGGMRAMALAYVYGLTEDERFKDESLNSLQKDLEAIDDFDKGKREQPYDLSNCGYFVMEASTVADVTKDDKVIRGLDIVAKYLISRQSEDGHWPGEWWEGSSGEHIADLVYGQNWATLGLQSYTQFTDDKKARESVKKSLEFLTSIQNKSDFAKTDGAWLGSYDAKRKTWGGEDRVEGGISSMYTGWTNAPISIALITDYTETRSILLPRNNPKVDLFSYGKIVAQYDKHKLEIDKR